MGKGGGQRHVEYTEMKGRGKIDGSSPFREKGVPDELVAIHPIRLSSSVSGREKARTIGVSSVRLAVAG